MSGVIGAIIGTGVAAAGAGIYSANKSASAETEASNNAINAQTNEFNTAQTESAPTRTLGTGADTLLGQLFGINPGTGTTTAAKPDYSNFVNSPGFQNSLNVGSQAINRNAAASGGLYSPNTLNLLSQYNTGAASSNYNNYVSSLLQSAGLGASSSTAAGNQAVETGQGTSTSLTNIGQAQASGIQQSAGSIGSLASNNNFVQALQTAFAGNSLPTQASTNASTGGQFLSGYNANANNPGAVAPTVTGTLGSF